MELIPVSKNGEYMEVHPAALAQHQNLGWQECAKQDGNEDETGDSMTVAEIKEKLAVLAVEIPAGVTKKADLLALLNSVSQD